MFHIELAAYGPMNKPFCFVSGLKSKDVQTSQDNAAILYNDRYNLYCRSCAATL